MSTAYQGYKNKLVTTIRDIIDDAGGVSKNNLEILEEAINTISLSKKQSISIFDNLFQINYGEQFSHYSTEQLTVVDGTKEQFVPDNIGTLTSDFERLTIIKNKVVLQRDIDYTISAMVQEYYLQILTEYRPYCS